MGGVVGRKEAEDEDEELTATVSVTGEKLHYRDLKCDSIYMAHIDLLVSVVDSPLLKYPDSSPKLVQVQKLASFFSFKSGCEREKKNHTTDLS